MKGQLCVDLIVEKNGSKYGINVKSGKNYMVAGSALNKMIKSQEKFGLPSFLFLNENGCYLFTLNTIFPSINDFLSNPDPVIPIDPYSDKRFYVVLIDPETKISKSLTVYNLTLDEGVNKIKNIFRLI